MTETDPPASRARLPRERDEQPAKPAAARAAPARQQRGLSRGMIVILIGTGLVGVLSFAVAKCADRGKATRARVHWNSPPPSQRTASLDDLRAQAEARAKKVVPGAQLARITGRQLDATGLVNLDYGSAGFEFVAPPGAAAGGPCGVEEGLAWQGWTQRTRSACTDTPLVAHCTFAAALARAFPTPPADLQFVLETADGAAAWTFWPLDPQGSPVAVPDDCAP